MRRDGVAMIEKPWPTIARTASVIRVRSPAVKCCAPLGPPSTIAQRGVGNSASRASGAARAAASRRGENGCGDVSVAITLGAAMAIVFGNPDEVHRRAGETRVLEKDGEHARAAGAFEGAQIGHGDAAAGEHDIGQRRPQQRRVARIDRPERRHPQERPARVDPLQLIGRTERLGDADRVDLVTRFARPKQKDAHALANPRILHFDSQSHLARQPLGEAERERLDAAAQNVALVGRVRQAVGAERAVERV